MRNKQYIGTNTGKDRHVVIAEAALGRPLPNDAEVHHVDGNGRNNASGNLVICPNRPYHILLHCRTRALDACGNPAWRKCNYCKVWDDPKNLYIFKNVSRHRACCEASRKQPRRNR